MFRIGYRTFKTAIAAPVAIYIAKFLELDNYISAGILAILSIQVTKKRSIISAAQRFVACIIGILYGFVFFEGISYHPFILGFLLLVFIPTTVALRIQQGVITSSVIILHLLMIKDVNVSIVFNELAIISIGIGVALLMNLYMPSMEKQLKGYQSELEDLIQTILLEYAGFLRNGDNDWDGKEIVKADQLIQKGKSLAFQDVENHLLRDQNEYYNYFKMREKQFEILERVLPIISSLDRSYVQSHQIADFLKRIADAIHPGNTAQKYLNELEQLRQSFREMELPSDRIEFETRSSLLHFLNEMEQYLILKRYFKVRDE
ncbi:aromatic acid exporter family protein [Alkalihalobacillus sp. AL-G]|uniref:aromatic acid exporter family protein n=1 Tax=Alkalihalobacillus sp. AL-G TaxID=2926399 RepID=UPI002729849E|nr:aromatic acid exporter family protein [Alkalihalobacillus sp. AL-G]WLD91963.1 aromatic acid exporter family protein [Alkalihalobacillus sp. AL-G]